MAASKLTTKKERVLTHDTQDTSEACSPCQSDNTVIPAETWCDDCNEFLCKDCSRYHRKLAALRHHRLVPVSDMKSRGGIQQFATKCDVHKEKRLSYFCEDHEVFCCSKCFVTMHRTCSKIVSLADAATHESTEFKETKKTLHKLDEGFKVQERKATENKELALQQNSKVNEQIDNAGTGLISAIKRLINEEKKKVNQIKFADLGQIQSLEREVNDADSSLKTCKDVIESGKGNEVELFFAMKHVQKVIQTLTLKLGETEKLNSVREFDFIDCCSLVNGLVLESANVLGFLVDTDFHCIEGNDEANLKLYAVRRFKQTSPSARWAYSLVNKDVTNVSTDTNTRLMYILLYSLENDRLEVILDIQEAGERLVHTTYSYKNTTPSDVFTVKVVGMDGMHGLTLQAGHKHKYRISVTIRSNMHPPSGYKRYCGQDKQGTVVSNGVTFTFFHYNEVQSNQIAGFMFSV